MNRKFLAGFLAASLVLTAAPVMPGMEANAEELSTGSQTGGGYLDLIGSSRAADIERELDFTGWWTAHTKGVEVTEEGVEVAFHSETYQTAAAGHNVPIVVAYTGTEAKVGGTGYNEYAVIRSDSYAWTTKGADANTGLGLETWNSLGYKFEGNTPGDSWLQDNKNGVDCIIKASRTSTSASIEFTNSTVTSTTTIPIGENDNNPFYISLTGEQCKISEVKVNGELGVMPEPPVVTEDTLDCSGYQVAFSNGYEVSESGKAVSFSSKTYDNAAANWNSPALIVYSASEQPKHNLNYEALKATAGYSELLYLRADDWGWCPSGDKTQAGWSGAGYSWVSRGVPSDWPAFVEANKKGVDGVASAVIENGKVVVKFSVNGLTEYITFPYSGTGKVYFSLSGEMCKLTDIKEASYKAITIPGQLASYPVVMPTAAPTPVPTPAPTLPPADDENSKGAELDCTGWWTAHTGGIEVTDSGMAVTFKNNTYSDAADVWNIPVIVAYSGDEAVVNGAGYDEYVVIRGDGYAWTTKAADANTAVGIATWNSLGYTYEGNTPGTTWLADNKSGTNCKVQAVKSNGKVVIETTVGDVTSKTTFPVDAGKKVYISLSGEKCKLTNIKPTAYTGIGGVTAQPTAAPSTEPGTSPDPSATAEPGSTNTPGNTDTPGTTEPTAAPGDKDPGTTDPGTNNPDKDNSNEDDKKDNETKKTMKVSGITAKAGKKKVTGNLSVKGVKVTVKVGNKKYKDAKVNGKKFTFTVSSKLKKGTKVTIKAAKSGYKTVTKTVKVK